MIYEYMNIWMYEYIHECEKLWLYDMWIHEYKQVRNYGNMTYELYESMHACRYAYIHIWLYAHVWICEYIVFDVNMWKYSAKIYCQTIWTFHIFISNTKCWQIHTCAYSHICMYAYVHVCIYESRSIPSMSIWMYEYINIQTYKYMNTRHTRINWGRRWILRISATILISYVYIYSQTSASFERYYLNLLYEFKAKTFQKFCLRP